jgi:hypothetical protein
VGKNCEENRIPNKIAAASPCITRREIARFEVAAFMVDEAWVEDGGRKGETWSYHVRLVRDVTVTITDGVVRAHARPGVTSIHSLS